MWRDGILTPVNSSSGGESSSSGSISTTYTLTQNPGVFASNFVPLWAGLADGDAVQAGRVVEALQSSGLVQPAGGWVGGVGCCCTSMGCCWLCSYTLHSISRLELR